MRLLLIFIAFPVFTWAQTQVITLNLVPQSSNISTVPFSFSPTTYQSYRVNVFDYSETSYKSYDILVGQRNQSGIYPGTQQLMIPKEGVFNYTPSLSSNQEIFRNFIKQLNDDKDPD